MKKKKYQMLKWAKELFPICRSLTGKGTRYTLRYFKKINPEFSFLSFKSGLKVFDWQIPLEWNIKDSYIQHIKTKKKFCEFKKNNLHIVGYSINIKKILDKKKLLKNIYTQKNQPKAIPYVTSYYKPRWGFCMSENEKKKLPEGKYLAYVNSSLTKGKMEIAEAVLKGKIKKEIFFSSYVCHPSMANNELSGPVLLNAIMLYLKNNFKNNLYTYRFVLVPETIGSIAYISKRLKILKKKIICGFNLTCVGDERAYSYVPSRSGTSLADTVIESALVGLKNVKKYSFLDRGSDERQYCSPKVDLPLIAFSRSKEFPEYHTDKDNFKLVSEKGLEESLEIFKTIINAFETSLYPKTNFTCEPNLGKRNLYPTLSQKGKYDDIRTRMHLIAHSDGKTNIFEISLKIKKKLKEVIEELKILKKNKIIS
jgi:aminopeptidase-like protein